MTSIRASAILLLAACAAAVRGQEPRPAAWPSPGIALDGGVGCAMPLTWYDGGPLLPHAAAAAEIGLTLELGEALRARLEASALRAWPSLPSGVELYRGWDGARFAALAGAGAPFGSGSAAVLGGAAATAAVYSGTPLVFAYPSALAELSLRIPFPRLGTAAVLRLPVEWMFRGAYTSASIGIGAGLELARTPWRRPR